MASAKAAVLGKTTKADLPQELFAEPFHQSLVHEAARADLAARRRGTASTLTRGEVSFTTAKAWRQKGTGRARVGSLGVPNRFGGGVAFGPKPRKYSVKVNR
jgi:large subunit ribosomal protein L4